MPVSPHKWDAITVEALEKQTMTIREANCQKKWMTCLRCGRRMYTDRCHRTCRRCQIAIRRLKGRMPDKYVALRDSFSTSYVLEDAE